MLPGRERKVKFHIVPFFPNSDWQEKNMGYQSFLSQRKLLLSCLSHFCVPGTWQLSDWGPPKYGWMEMWIALHFVRVLLIVASSRGNCLCIYFFWLSLVVVLDFGSVVSFIVPLGTSFMSMGLFSTARDIYSLSRLKPDKIF